MSHFVKLDLNIDLSIHSDVLINRPSPYGPKSCPITRQELFNIVPKLGELDYYLGKQGLAIYGPSIMSIEPGTFGILHVDWAESNKINDLRLNIPIKNGTSMTTRWYDLTGLPYDKIDWTFDRSNLCEGDLWFLANQELLTTNHCVETLHLDRPCLFNSGIPHNVDGRHSSVTRSILGINIIKLATVELLQWQDKQQVIDAVAELVQNS